MNALNETRLPPHPLSPAALAYINSLSPEVKKLHELAVVALGSSYFVEKTHGFLKAQR